MPAPQPSFSFPSGRQPAVALSFNKACVLILVFSPSVSSFNCVLLLLLLFHYLLALFILLLFHTFTLPCPMDLDNVHPPRSDSTGDLPCCPPLLPLPAIPNQSSIQRAGSGPPSISLNCSLAPKVTGCSSSPWSHLV